MVVQTFAVPNVVEPGRLQLALVTADPGCGKSLLSKFLIGQYSTDRDTIHWPVVL